MSSSLFSGVSRYSTDFQQIIERAVAIASLPLQQLGNQRNALDRKATALTNLDTRFTALQTAISALQSAVQSGAESTEIGDETVVQAHVTSGALQGNYEIEVVALGAQTNALSLATLPVVVSPFAESITSASSLTLTVNGVDFVVTPAAQNLVALAESINAADAGVHATIVNLGTSASPDYRLSLQSDTMADVPIQLNDGSDLLEITSSGSNAQYRVNGQPATPISSDSRSVLVSPGLTVDLKKAGTTTITVGQSQEAIQTALATFVTSFNAAVGELDLHRGKSEEALSGDRIVYDLGQSLRQIAGYSTGTNGLSSLESLGFTFDRNGLLHFNESEFETATAGQLDELLTFLGDSATSGFLFEATQTLDLLEDPIDGLIDSAIDTVNNQLTAQDRKIEENQERIDLMRETMTAKIAAADALIASLEQQVVYFNGLFQAMRSNSESR